MNRFLKKLTCGKAGEIFRSWLSRGLSSDGNIEAELLAESMAINIVEEIGERTRFAIAVFTESQKAELLRLLNPIAQGLVPVLSNLVKSIWKEYRAITPTRLHDQVNQYIACCTHSIVSMVINELESQGIMDQPAPEMVHTASLMIVTR